MHKKLLAFALIFVFTCYASAQQTYKYVVRFTDKNGSGYTLDNPSEYLSTRALERRARQNISIDSLDLPVNPYYLQQLREAGLVVRNCSKWKNCASVDADSSISDWSRFPFVAEATCYYIEDPFQFGGRFSSGWQMPRPAYDTLYSESYYGLGIRQISQLNGIGLHREGFQGEGMLIGVCDVGFPGIDTLVLFDSLRNDGRLIARRDFVWPHLADTFDLHDHGTSVLSNLASYIPGCYVGTAPKASYILCRTEDMIHESPLEEYNWIAAVEYLDSMGADIVSTSLGYYYFDDPQFDLTPFMLNGSRTPMSQAATIASNKGMLIVNSAGNDGNSIPQHLNIPADAEAVLTIGAVDEFGDYAYFSSRGPTYDDRIKPDICAMGMDVRTASVANGIQSLNGTSFSCPIAAGMMACLWQKYPDWTPAQLRDSVRSWGDHADAPNNHYGYGIPDFGKALEDTNVSLTTVDELHCSLYPNPSHGMVQLFVDDANAYVSIFDAMGRTIIHDRYGNSALQTTLNSLPKGFYLIRITSEQRICTMKLIRQ